ncbi:MAG: hypothetical protein Q4D81_00305 [Eubacteriales bacterium]|nr:hypothetical protein [Eubacteriales bacterium]
MDAILITGKTGLFSNEALAYIGKSYNVLLAGKKRAQVQEKLPANVRRFAADLTDTDFQKAFEARQILAVWHVSRCADGGRPADENARLQRLLQLCSRNGVPRLIILTESVDPTDYRQLIEDWTFPEKGFSPVGVAVVHLPLLSGSGIAAGRINRIFSAMRSNKEIELEGTADTQFSVLPVRELTALLLRMSSETWFRRGIFSADGSAAMLENFRHLLLTLRPDAEIRYTDSQGSRREGRRDKKKTAYFRLPVSARGSADGRLMDMYRLPASSDWSREITSQYTRAMEETQSAGTAGERFRAMLPGVGSFAGAILDIAIMFFIAEYLAGITSESVYFKVVDVRVLFVVLMGMMHGLAAGMGAALLECMVLVSRYNEIGISGILLFYNVENWIPFVYYLTAGVISGYTHQKNRQERKSVDAENELIRNKYIFLNEAYQSCVSDRKELRAQILSEEESYEKLYDAVLRMSQRTPEAVCVEAVGAMRRILENDTVSIYQADKAHRQARILSCCMEGAPRQNLVFSDYPEMLRKIGAGEIWKNASFVQGAPMYASMIRYNRVRETAGAAADKQQVTLIVTVEQAYSNQLSLWYMNHFSILCGLLQKSLENASLRERSM